jgi:hypothetical protein
MIQNGRDRIERRGPISLDSLIEQMGPPSSLSFHHSTGLLFSAGLRICEELLPASRCESFQWLLPVCDGIGGGHCGGYIFLPSKARFQFVVLIENLC